MDECNTCDADPTNDCVLGCNNPDAINFDPAATHDDGSCIVCDPMNLQVEATDASCAGGDGSVDISHDCAGGNSLLTPELAKFQESIDMSLFNFEACMWGQAESCEMWVMDGLASVGGIDPFELRDELEALDGAYPMLALFLEASWNAPFAFEACMTGDVNMCAEWSWQMQVGIDTWWLMDELYTLSTLTDDSDCATVITNGDGEEVSSTGLDAGDYLVTLSMPDGCSESVTTTVAGPDNCQQLCDAGDQNICCLLGDVWACVDLCNQADSESCVKACELGNNETCQIACSQGTVEACIPSCDVYQTLDDCTSACDQGDQEACDTLPCLTTGCSSMNAIGNTICDASCNNTECNFDGGDCD